MLQRVHQLHEAIPNLLCLYSGKAVRWRPGDERQLNLLEWRGCCRKVKLRVKVFPNSEKVDFMSFLRFRSILRHCCRYKFVLHSELGA